ncbi:MAG: carboxypeptidase regulatory-like domain-containing protein [Bacillota bacterium]|nr:carboxypeptidase regulatory-like domain-containing protein [Bacillota bacterium]
MVSTDHCLALKTDGSLWAWGLNDAGQVGDGNLSFSSVPIKVFDSDGIIVNPEETVIPKVAGIEKCKIYGYVKTDSSDNFKDGFNVELDGGVNSTYTDDRGYFEINITSPINNTYTLKISKPSYLSKTIKNIEVLPEVKINSLEFPISILGGDVTKDGIINMFDVIELAKSFNLSIHDKDYKGDCDINKDNVINLLDVIILAKHFNRSSSESIEDFNNL